jgi:hypothetical protein
MHLFWKWLREKLGIAEFEKIVEDRISFMQHQVSGHREFVGRQMAELKEYTRVDADVGFRGNNTIVLTGVYRRQGFVRFYDLGDGEFERLVEMLQDMRKHALIRHIDAPPQFRGVFDI